MRWGNSEIRTLLIFPPLFFSNGKDIDYLPLGTAALTGFLQRKNLFVRQLDLNLEFREFLFNECFLKFIGNSRQAFSFFARRKKKHAAELKNAFREIFLESVLDDKYVFKHLFSPDQHKILDDIKDASNNIYYLFYKKSSLSAYIKRYKINLVGFSVLGPQQALASFTLAFLIKRSFPGVHVTCGGPWITLLYKELMNRSELLSCVDSFIVSEGETPLYKLILGLKQQGELATVPNLVYRSNLKFIGPFSFSVENFVSLPPPSFDNVALNKYDYPNTITYQTSRGCYWHKCAFCENLYRGCDKYRQKEIKGVINDMLELKRKYNIKRIVFCDDAILPARLLELSREVISNNVGVSWICFARPEKQFTRDIFKIARRAGCESISFGLDSGNERILRLMQKGIDLNTAVRLIKDCAAEGIKVGVGAIIGLPTETKEEAQDTITFLLEHLEYIDLPVLNVFRLRRGSIIYNNPDKYKIVIEEKRGDELRQTLNFVNLKGISPGEARELIEREFLRKFSVLAIKEKREKLRNLYSSYNNYS